ncbi:MAG: MBL fold metallo-hydrolase [Elusimicrobia bacterium]|nr:MBL fold metallo-hydrolase [Elusimicrobiota bacterium]
MKIEILVLGPMGNCTYLVSQNGVALLVDPSWDMEEIERALHGQRLAAVFFTHGHFDHVKDVEPMLRKHNIKAYIEEADAQMSGLPSDVLQTFTGDKKLKTGGFDIEILHTPGHSAGGVCIKIGDNLFTGDTLFPGACGRVDLPTSNPRQMRASLYRLSQLPGETKIYAGHGYGPKNSSVSTIEYERAHNRYMQNAIRDYSK